MASRRQRERLPEPGQVEQIFSNFVVSRIAQRAGVKETAITQFGDDLRRAVENYLRDARRLDAGEIREALENLSRKVEAALKGRPGAIEEAAGALATLPADARAFLDRLALGTGEDVPASSDLLDRGRGRQALLSLDGLCVREAKIAPGRDRPGGKQSRPIIKKVVTGPPVKRRRSSNISELMLCFSLGSIFWEATGRLPFRGFDRPEGRGAFDRGEFVRFVQDVLNGIGHGFGADDLVQDYLDDDEVRAWIKAEKDRDATN